MTGKNDRPVRILTAVLAALLLLGGAALAEGAGTQSDPLVTVSYLDQTVIPAILAKVDGNAEEYRQQLVEELDETVKGYSRKMDEALAAQQSQTGGTAAYAVVTLSKGQQLKMEIGCEAMLRIGTAQCVAPAAPGLIDVTDGQPVNDGAALTVNHLCMATISGRAIKATAGTVKLLVRGGYTIA